ncbi:MAG TPA: 4Fe-4S dicluster domain-containing protein [Rhizobiales bacterium]|nr:4Fe-4S dicluster domain-containing protein [Hyphomicrobiales bacterium]
MTQALPQTASRKYDLTFARWVRDNVEGGDKLNMCMQCGTCSGSCPIGAEMDNGPRKTIMMVRAGMKNEVLSSTTLWNCTSCYRCTVRCPRGIKVTALIQGLAGVARAEGYAPKVENARFAKYFWWSARTFGKTDERLVTMRYFFSFGMKEGIRRALDNLKIAIGMVKAGRMHIGMPHTIKDKKGLQAILDKAAEIDSAKG